VRYAKQQQDLPSPSGHEALPYGHAIEISFLAEPKKRSKTYFATTFGVSKTGFFKT
jgi:hypothetical protein